MKIINLVLNNFVNDSRVLKTSRTLSELGYDVQIVALHEGQLAVKENAGGIEVHRIELFSREWPKFKLLQVLKLMEFIIRFTSGYRAADVLHCNDLNGLLVGVFCKLTQPKIRLVYDSHEFAINDIPNQSAYSIKLKQWLEGVLIRFSCSVINVSDSIAHEYARLYKIPKPNLVLNCPLYNDVSPHNIFREKLNIRYDQKIFLYQGGLSKGRGIELLLEAFTGLESDENVLVCMGYGPLEALIREKESSESTIFFHPAVSPNVLLNYTSSADYGILFYEDTCLNHRFCSPNKIFEYLMAGLPVITSNLFEMKRLVESEKVGIVAENNSVDGFKKAIRDSLLQNYSIVKQNVLAARKKYCWEEQEKVLRKVYSDVYK